MQITQNQLRHEIFFSFELEAFGRESRDFSDSKREPLPSGEWSKSPTVKVEIHAAVRDSPKFARRLAM
jgi:hypothetical protein